MDNLVNILRKSTTPKGGVSPEDTYANGVGFFNPLMWGKEERAEMESSQGEYPGMMPRSAEGSSTTAYHVWPDINGVEYAEEITDGKTTGLYGVEGDYLVDPESLRKNISDKTNGRVVVSDNITNPKALKDISDTIDKIVERWGTSFLPNKVKIGDASRSVSTSIGSNDGWAGITYKNGLSPNYIRWKDTDDTDRRWSYGNWGGNGWSDWHPVTAIDSTPAHEIGHTVMNSANSVWPNSLLERVRWANDMERDYDVTQTEPDISAENISGYATTSPREAFAEAFADVVLNGEKASPDSTALVNWYKILSDALSEEKEKVSSQNPFDRETQYTRIENLLKNRSTLNP